MWLPSLPRHALERLCSRDQNPSLPPFQDLRLSPVGRLASLWRYPHPAKALQRSDSAASDCSLKRTLLPPSGLLGAPWLRESCGPGCLCKLFSPAAA